MSNVARDLVWDGCLNVRDLGGHPTEDGGETRFGAVVRADNVRRLSDHGWAALVAHGVATIVDLRYYDELADDPPRDLPVELVHVPLPGVYEAFPHLEGIAETYLEFLERQRSDFARAVGAVARAREGGVVVHCLAGKDRTGLVVGLLLRLAGVSLEVVAADYAVSEASLAAWLRPWVDGAEDGSERARRERMRVAPAEVMSDALAELERRHGSVREYLLAGGASEAELDRARERLR